MTVEFDEKSLEALLQDFLKSKQTPKFYANDLMQGERNRRAMKQAMEEHVAAMFSKQSSTRRLPKFPSGGINRCIDPLYDPTKGEREEEIIRIRK